MTINIVRLTRHEAEAAQMAELHRIYGDAMSVNQVSETLPMDARGAVVRFDEIAGEAKVVEAVLPVHLLEAVLKFSAFAKRGGQLIRAITARQVDAAGQATFVFVHYERVLKVEIVTEKL